MRCVDSVDGGASATGGGRRRFAITPIQDSGAGETRVVQVPLEQIDRLSSVRVYVPKDLRPVEARERVGGSLREVLKRFSEQGGPPLLSPEEDMKAGAPQPALIGPPCMTECA